MHYYQHSIGDYRRDTMHLTLLEHGVYRQLIDLYYLNECELNANALRLICARSSDEIQAAESVLNEFFIKTDNGYKHKRCDAEILKYQDKSAKAKASADMRWKGENAKIMRPHNESNADDMLTNNHKPITINHKPLTNIKPLRANALDNGFNEFWQQYPKKVGKDAALKSWLKTKAKIDDVLKALAWQKESDQWLRNDGQFIPNPATYLNQGRWQDEQPVIDVSPF
jgi:uncharacterized protein YdaU (DUF1376 family)